MTTHAAPLRRRPYWTRAAAVLQEWIREPAQVASLVPSAPALTQRVAKQPGVSNATKIVDLGPGTGGTTEALLAAAAENCRVLALEKAAGFIEPLNEIVDGRLTVEHADVVGLERILLIHQMTSPDVIVSGIPFSSLDRRVATDIIKSVHRTLPKGGTFIAYQLRSDVARYASPLFGTPQTEIVWMNVPPLRIFTWTKQ
ncbi:class I SAM-dependent methyltransferase [Rosistilla oblonga]|uniref:class I SAM-dependent methyltransferase n=1 Tax=Rosistilla oblonga TaxID=2527990 RepID=UPI003A96DABC